MDLTIAYVKLGILEMAILAVTSTNALQTLTAVTWMLCAVTRVDLTLVLVKLDIPEMAELAVMSTSAVILYLSVT